jgi:hypothetical protein
MPDLVNAQPTTDLILVFGMAARCNLGWLTPAVGLVRLFQCRIRRLLRVGPHIASKGPR